MTPVPPIPRFLSWVISLAIPKDRRNEILADLEDSFRSRTSRQGETSARRHLYREVASLLLWRLQWWRGATATREAAGATSMKSKLLGQDFLQDFRFGVRTLLRRPAFTVTAVVVLGLGIGAPATVLTLVKAIFFEKPAHIQEPDRIVRLTRSFEPGQGGASLGNADYLYYRESTSTLSGLAASGGARTVAFSAGDEEHDQLRILFVSDNFFDVLRVSPVRGRGFLSEENTTPGTQPVVVLGHHFWIRALGGDPEVVGRDLTLAGAPYTVVGVTPEGFGSVSPAGEIPDAWVPIAMYGALTRATDTAWWERMPHMRDRWLVALGRLAPGMTFEAARENLVALGEALEYSGKDENEGAFLQRQFLYSPRLQSTLTSLAQMLLVVVGMVLLVAAFNVAVLLLSRASTRYREMGIRTALGAGRGRITRQILVETLILGVAGGAVGLGLAYGFSDVAASLLPVPFATEFRPGLMVAGVAAGLSVLTALAVGLIPALHAGRADLRGAIQGGGTEAPKSRIRNILVVGQVGLSLVLVAGAILFGRSFWTARTQELGFATDNRLVVRVNLRDHDYDAEQGMTFIQQALDRIRDLPGVQGAAVTRQVPYQGDWTTEFDAPPGAVPNYGENQVMTGMNAVGRDYFQVAGIPIIRGRPLGPEDVQGSTPVVIVNERLADLIWPNQNPLGRTLSPRNGMTFEVIGVARTAEYYELGEDPFPQAYIPVEQFYQARIHFLVHTSGSAAEMAPVVQATLREMDPSLAFGWVSTMASVFEDETSRYEVSAILVAVFSAVALLLAAVGLYGTLSFLVARSTREIGVRMALGADRNRVAGEVMRFGLRLVLGGIVAGLAGAMALRRFTESLLYQIEPNDPLPLLGACLVLLAVAVLATFAPARLATRVDPMEAIRTE